MLIDKSINQKAAVRFGAFEMFHGLLSNKDGSDKYGLGSGRGFLAGLGAGTAEAILVGPRGLKDGGRLTKGER